MIRKRYPNTRARGNFKAMFGLGFSEIMVLGVLALILLGPEQLPDLARKLGKFINEIKRTTDGLKDEFTNAGINPSNLLEEIKREGPTAPEAAQTPESIQPVENPQDALKSGHNDQAHQPAEKVNPTGSDDSGKA